MRFAIKNTGRHLWAWVLLDDHESTIAESPRTFPSEAQASAAALAFAQMVARAGRTIAGTGRSGGLM